MAASKQRIGLIVAASLAAGLVVAVLLVASPFIPARPAVLTGTALLAFASGWLLLAVLSTRFTDQPQRWAVGPAAFFAVSGLVSLLPPGSMVPTAYGWVWPPLLLGLVGWVGVQARRRLRSRTRRGLVLPLCLVLAFAAIGGGYETVREFIDATAYPAPGRLFDVDGHRMHLDCTGSGAPTVVLEPGLGEASSVMAWIAPAVGRDTRVCRYDRIGRGWSDPGDGPRDAVQTAADLHRLLDRAEVPGPYVLAGHSFGGLYAMTYAATYPDQVAGLVLLDSTAPDPAVVPPPADSSDVTGRISLVAPALAHLGIARLYAQTSYSTLPPRSRDEARATASTAGYVESLLAELRAGPALVRQGATLVDLGAKPLVVLTAGRGHDVASRTAQEELATLSTNSRHRTAPDATHASLLLDERDAAATVQAIRDVVTAVRTGRPVG